MKHPSRLRALAHCERCDWEFYGAFKDALMDSYQHAVDNRHQVIMAREDDTKTFIGYSFFEHDRFTVNSEGDPNPMTRRDRYPWSHLKDRMEVEK